MKEEFVDHSAALQNEWSCIEVDKGQCVQRMISFEKVVHKEAGATPKIEDPIQTMIGDQAFSGTLICNSEMGITPIDLFNDILTASEDILTFLQQCHVIASTDQPGMIIQGMKIFGH